jgi:hypothetical protein
LKEIFMRTKSRQPFDWAGLLFLAVTVLTFVFIIGSLMGDASDQFLLSIAVLLLLSAASSTVLCYSNTRKYKSQQWWPATIVSGAVFAGACVLIYTMTR